MTKYIIKVTYLEGKFEGQEYYLNKGGYVTNPNSVWQEDSYTLAACKAVCARKEKTNTADVIFEKRMREKRIANGKPISKYPIYIMSKYEPFAIETVD